MAISEEHSFSLEENFINFIIKQSPLSVFWKDMNGVYLGCNEKFAHSLGLSSNGEVIGKTDFDLSTNKEESEAYRKDDHEVVESRQPKLNFEESQTLPNDKKKFLLTSKLPLIDRQGNVCGVLGISLDITERKKIEEELRLANEKAELAKEVSHESTELQAAYIKNIIENLPEYIYWKNIDFAYLGCNKHVSESLGLDSPNEIIGKTDQDFGWDHDRITKLHEIDQQIISQGKPITVEEVIPLSSGPRIMLSSKSPMRNKRGKVIGILGVSTDITPLKEMEQKLSKAKDEAETANKAKTEFLENMRHDIRTPLTGIVGFANIIADEVNDPKIKEYVDNLTASSNALHDLLNEILEVIRVGSSELPLLKKKFNLKEKLTGVIKLNRARALQKHLNLIFEYDNNIPINVIGDPTRIHRIVLELLVNALNFTNKGWVKLAVQLAKQTENKLIIKIIVEDTGIGIPLDKQDEIFLQFKKLMPSYKGIYKGAGLGLTIIKSFIDELDGEIYVESQEGKGSKFICILPLKKPLLDDEFDDEKIIPSIDYTPEQPTVVEVSLEVESTTRKGRSRIILVEDEPLAAKVAQNLLTNLDCDVSWAKNGKMAIELFQEDHHDLVFMDIGLPDIDGYEVTRRMRLFELNQDKHAPIIALTAHVDEENKQHCINVGMNAVLSKPLSKDKAKDILNAFIPYREQSGESPQAVKKDISSILPEDKVIDFESLKGMYGNNKEIMSDMLAMLVNGFPEELRELGEGYEKKDWSLIQAIAHKLAGGASYCGTVRLKKACSQLELAIKERKTELFLNFYQQVLNEIEAVKKAVEK